MVEEKLRFRRIIFAAAKNQLAERRLEIAISFLEVVSAFLGESCDLFDYQEVHRLLYDAYYAATCNHQAHATANKLYQRALTDEDLLEAASMQIRCLALLDPHRGIDYSCEVLMRFAQIDVRSNAKTITSLDNYRVGGPEPFLPTTQPSRFDFLIQQIMVQSIVLFYPIDPTLGMAAISLGAIHAQVRML